MHGRANLLLALVAVVTAVVAAPAHAQYFGKNKVQYKDFEWAVLETENFEVYYYKNESEAAVDAARMAERSYRRLSHLLDHRIRDKVPLVLYASHADFQSTNISPGFIGEGTGGITEFLKRRVFLPFTGSYAELEHVLTHELVHAFQVDILWGGDSRSLLTNPFAFQPPLWIMEGSAEYLSMGGVDPLTEMWLRDGALQGYLTPIPVLNRVYDIRVYRYGQAVFEYIGRRFGPEKVGELLKRIAASRNVDQSVRRVTGLSLEKLSEQWLEEVRRTYLPQIAEHEKPDKFAKRLTDHEKENSGFNLSPAVSPEGDKVVFVSSRDLNQSIYLASTLDGRILDRLVDSGRSGDLESLRFFYSSFDWSPDGRLIAFPAKSEGKDDINLLDVGKGRRVARLRFDLDGVRSPSFSPDGTRLVFAGFDGGHSDLYVCDLDGGNLTRLTRDPFSVMSPRFSPDGSRILFITDRGPETDYQALIFGSQRMAIYEVATGEVTVLPNQVGNAVAPHFSPDGSRILYVSDRSGIANLFRYDLATEESAQLTNILTGISGLTIGSPPLSVSRNGKRLVFSAFSAGGWDLYCMKDPFEAAAFDTAVGDERATSSILVRRADGLGALMRDMVIVPEDTGPDSTLAGAEASVPDHGSIAADSLITVLARPDLDGFPGPPGPGGRPEEPPGEIPVDGDARSPTQQGSTLAPIPDPGDEDEDDRAPFVNLRPPRGGVAGLDSVRADSLIAVMDALPDPASFEHRRYKSKFSADYGSAAAAVGGGLGVAGQAVVSFSDILGNKQILVGASVYGSITDADLLFQYVDRGNRNNLGFALFQFRNDFLLSTASTADEYQSNIYRGGEVFISRPFDLFHRVELGVQGVAVTERIFRNSFFDGDDLELNLGTTFYVTPSLALVKDTALYGHTGPIKGTRARLGVRQALGGATFTDVTADLRRYININTRYSLAGRVLGATSVGPDPQIFRAGGPFTNRAVDYGELEGSNILLTNLEFRFPFIDLLDVAFPLPLRFGGVRGALFFDAGAAWGESYLIGDLNPEEQNEQREFTPWDTAGGFRLDDLKAAYGFGIRMNLGFFLIRWDLARATDLRDNLGEWKGYFALGGEF